VRLGEVMVHARVLLRLRGRKERDHHEQGSIQHRVGLVRGWCETPRGCRAITANEHSRLVKFAIVIDAL
tara:strand:- start:536 stop:742 length:207 start_codon:yes stop_codon:yes gene_type:complete